VTALLAGTGIGDLPPIVQPEALRDGRLVEVMPKWHSRLFNLSVVHLGNRYISRPVRVFKEFAVQMAPTLFPAVPGFAIGKAGKPPKPPPIRRAGVGIVSLRQCLRGEGSEEFRNSLGCLSHAWNLRALVSRQRHMG
jgi:hypothetical protein